MDHRKHNIYFHTHTISGIFIAALLYVIFFAGSFSFFRDPIGAWQKGRSNVTAQVMPDYNYLFDSLSQHHQLQGRDFEFFVLRQGNGAYVSMSASRDTVISSSPGNDPAYFLYYFSDKRPTTYADEYDMGEFLYRLHFLAQLNQVPIRLGAPFGYLLAGIVSFMFLFALITGLLLHWEKIRTNFFLFRPWSKWKTVWTDLHTVLGVIGFPFQFVYAVTGIVLIANFGLIVPFSNLLYGGSQEQLYENLRYSYKLKSEYSYTPIKQQFDMNATLGKWQAQWDNSRISRIFIRNFQDQQMEIGIEAKPAPKTAFAGSGFVREEVATGKILELKSPDHQATYTDKVKSLIFHLHFGDFGGLPLQIIFFILGLTGCVVILSGIMIWLVARDKTHIPAYKRKFNFRASNVFLSACLSMLPVTAFTFIMVKLLPVINQSVIYQVYFYSWLAVAVYFIVRRNLPLINRQALLLSGVLCLFVPITNGISTGLWMWVTWQQGAVDIFLIDALFLTLAAGCAFAFRKVRQQAQPFIVLKGI